MDQNVQLPPFLLDAGKERFQLTRLGYIERREDRRVQPLGQRLDMRPRLLVQIGDRQVGTDLTECPGTAVGD